MNQSASNIVINLTDYGILKVSGPDAAKLLQGQLTCDITLANATNCLLGAHCNPQGRIISLFHLFADNECFYLIMRTDMLEIAQQALKKYAVFFKVALSIESELKIAGVIGSHGDTPFLYQFNIAPNQTILINNTYPTASHNQNYWLAAKIQNGLPEIYPTTSLKFLPHELNLHELGGVSFDKGCYTGQEIIARMHYRGKLKKRMYIVTTSHDQESKPGSDVFINTNNHLEPVGTIVSSAKKNNGSIHLVVVDDTDARDNHILLHPTQNIFLKFNQAKSA